MTNMEIKRDHNAKLHLFVDGKPALGAIVTDIGWVGDKQCAKVMIPLEYVTFGEVDSIVPFLRPTG